jgi:transcriptional regulator with XRE-family HTH domain
MDGRQKASEILRELRRSNGLTQRGLASLARVPQPTVAAIESGQREPSLSLLSRIVESAGYVLKINLAPLPRFGATNTALRIEEALRSDDRTQDSALRLLITFRDVVRDVDDVDLVELIGEPPSSTGSPQWDAFLAAVVEDESARRDVAPPRWVNDRSRFLKPFWHLSTNPLLHEWEFESTPAAFLRHGIVVAAEELASV